MTSPLASSYGQARARFLEASSAAGARVETFAHPDAGPNGEDLAVDLAWLAEAEGDQNLVLVVSGTHGVEGFAGSAIQTRHIVEGIELAPSTSMVMLHALNPYGFAWVRRTNEDNIDLNRNFVDFDARPVNERYGPIADVLVPDKWDEATQQATLRALLELLEQRGMPEVQEIVSGGQYDHPKGLFYGGVEPSWANRLLRDLCSGPFARFDRVVIVDLHTGLGPWGVGELISSVPDTSDAFEADQAVFGDDLVSLASGESVSAQLAGEWISAVTQWLSPAQVHAVAIEYGVVEIIQVLMALRADAWLHGYGDPTGSEAAPIKQALRAVFADDDPEWHERTWQRYQQVWRRINQALSA